MLIPYADLSQDALYSLAREWVVSNLSEIESQPDLTDWTEQTIKKIKKGDLLIEFGEESQTVYLKTKEEISIAYDLTDTGNE